MDNYVFQLKFVVASVDDVTEIQLLLRDLRRTIPAVKILLMPEGTSVEVLRGRETTLIDVCKRYGYRYCSRLHVQLFGHTRGT